MKLTLNVVCRENDMYHQNNDKREIHKDVFIEFVEVLIHQVIYLMKIYPDSIYLARRKFNIPVKMSNHPWVNNYIEEILETLKTNLNKEETDFDSVDVVILHKNSNLKDKFKLEFQKNAFDQLMDVFPEDHVYRTELNLASMLMRLSSSVDSLTIDKDEEREWWMEFGSTVEGARTLMQDHSWCLAETDAEDSRDIIPVMGIEMPFKLQLYIESAR